jgi:phosphate transport system substrate-binding protein
MKTLTRLALPALILPLAATLVDAQSAASAQPAAVALPRYAPRAVPAPRPNSTYLLADGSIRFAGNDLVELLFSRYDELFTRTHPGFRFKMDMQDSNLALAGITSGKSAFGPIGRDATRPEIEAFTALHGYPPTDILLGYDQSPNLDIFPPGKVPAAIWINVRNPLPLLTVEQLARIFKSGEPAGDLTVWGQLGLGGEWASRQIHVYMPGNREAAFVDYVGDKLGAQPYSRHVEWLPGAREVMAAVAQDPFGIGLVGYWPPDSGWDRQAELGDRTRLVPVAANAEGEPKVSRAAVGDLYPLTPGIHLFIDRAPGQAVEPWIAEYVRLALSREGQALIVAMAQEDHNGFIPLEPKDVAAQLKKIE